MAYDGIGFVNDNPPAINATNLNKMDNEIKRLSVLDEKESGVLFNLANGGYQYDAWQFRMGTIKNNGNYTSGDNTNISTVPSSMKFIKKGDYIYCDSIYRIRTFIYSRSALSSSTLITYLENVTDGIVNLDAYEGKFAAVRIEKVGSESSDIQADLPTIGEHVRYYHTTEMIDDAHDEIKLNKGLIAGASDVTQSTLIKPYYHYGNVTTANSDDSGIVQPRESYHIYSEEIYVGNAYQIIFGAIANYTYRVACYDENHVYYRAKSLRGEQSSDSNIVLFERPRKAIKYVRIVWKRNDGSMISDADFTAVNNAEIRITSNNCYFENARQINNPLINAMSHQGFNLASNSHGNTNRMTSFWGAYQRGFDTLLCNVQFTADNKTVLNHDGTITISGTTYTISQTNLQTLQDAYAAIGSYLPTFDDICWFGKMTGMKIFVANGYSGEYLDILWNILKKYQMQYNMNWLASSDTVVAAVIAKDRKAKLYYYFTPSGQTAEAMASSVSTQIAQLNSWAETYPDATFSTWMEVVYVSDSSATFANALAIINSQLSDNVMTGVCNVNSAATYVNCAPYMSSYHSDFTPPGICMVELQQKILDKFPVLSDYIRML